ncbi:MAG TPA: winged helix-turn-helix transcriptional regulator [Thermoleophilaceae bacterium]|nr:winged helix-turn-helix transcriptional regulator [Thermoleophilaceae bacterium]
MTPRSYGEGCAAAHALDLVGERWALLVVRELILGPRRFTDLRAGIPGAGPNVLSQRLRELDHAGVIRHRRLEPRAASSVYELTEWGRDLEPVLQTLGRWGVRSPAMPFGAPISVSALILSLRTMADGRSATGPPVDVELHLDDERFHVRAGRGRMEIDRGNAEDADAVVATDPATLNALLLGDRELDDAVRSGQARVQGDPAAFASLQRLFPLPAAA